MVLNVERVFMQILVCGGFDCTDVCQETNKCYEYKDSWSDYPADLTQPRFGFNMMLAPDILPGGSSGLVAFLNQTLISYFLYGWKLPVVAESTR